MTTLAFKQAGDAILLVGGHGRHLGQSIYLREILGREEGSPPPVDLARERRHGELIRNLIDHGQVTAVHDISDGGLGVAAIEMALAGGLGASLAAMDHVALFAEDQARYLVACPAAEAGKIITQAHAACVDVIRIGTVTADPSLIVDGAASISLAELRVTHEGWFPGYMAGEV